MTPAVVEQTRCYRVLVVDVRTAHARISRVLGGMDVAFVTRRDEALAALQSRTFDVVIVGVDGDPSQGLDMVSHLARRTPVICVRASDVAAPIIQCARLLASHRGARLFIDFHDYEDSIRGDRAIRTRIMDLC